jgi:acyl-CoA thioesterase
MTLRGIKISSSVDLVTEDCCACGMLFAMTADFQNRRREDRNFFHCPDGHPQRYTGKSKADQLAEELSRERQRKAQLEDEVKWQRDRREAAERRASAARGQVTRLKNRASAGVCPCCNRSFAALARHMATKHPQFRAEDVSDQGATIQ